MSLAVPQRADQRRGTTESDIDDDDIPRGSARGNPQRAREYMTAESHLKELHKSILSVLQNWMDTELGATLRSIDQKLADRIDMSTQCSEIITRPPSLLGEGLKPNQDRKATLQIQGNNAQKRASHISAPPRFSEAVGEVSWLDSQNSEAEPRNSNFSSNETYRMTTYTKEECHSGGRDKSVRFGFSKTSLLLRKSTRASSWVKDSLDKVPSEERLEAINALIEKQHRRRYSWAVWQFLQNPHSSRLAWLYSHLIPVMVLINVVISFLLTLEEGTWLRGSGLLIQTIFEIIFAIELVVRFVVSPDRCAYFFSWCNWVDALSIVPLIVKIFAGWEDIDNDEHASVSFAKTVVITVPVFSLLKISRRFETFNLLFEAFACACEALPVIVYMLAIIVVLFSTLLYFLESSDNIGNLPRALYLMMVTISTVGYGDVTPLSPEGKSATVVLMFVSSLYMAIPLGIVGSAFGEVWSNRDRLLLMHRIRESIVREGFTRQTMREIIEEFDGTRDGYHGGGRGILTLMDFKKLLEAMAVKISDDRISMLYEVLDLNDDGSVDSVEMLQSLFPDSCYSALNRYWAVKVASPEATRTTYKERECVGQRFGEQSSNSSNDSVVPQEGVIPPGVFPSATLQ